MSKSIGFAVSAAMALALVGTMVVAPAVGEAADGTAKITLSLTKDYTPSPWTSESGWSNRFSSKLGFGLKNLLLGWTSLFTEPKKAADEGGNVFVGVAKGVKNAIENELGGVVHVVTSPITEIDAPLPNGGTQVLNS